MTERLVRKKNCFLIDYHEELHDRSESVRDEMDYNVLAPYYLYGKNSESEQRRIPQNLWKGSRENFSPRAIIKKRGVATCS